MLLKKRQNRGFNGSLFPSIPRAPRSARGKYLGKRKVEDSQLCAIELLASLAGKLLRESESSASSNASEANDIPGISDDIKQEKDHELLKTEHLNVECCEENVFIPEFASPSSIDECLAKESPCAETESDSILEHSSCNSMEKVSNGAKSEVFKSDKVCADVQEGVNRLGTKTFAVDSSCSSKDPVKMCLKRPALINGDNIKLSPHREQVNNASVLGHRNNINLGFRDDDEKFSRSYGSISKPKAFRSPPRIGDRRIRKLLTSKYWKVAPKLKDCKLPNVEFLDGGMKPLYHKRKMCYNRERYHRDTLCKRRKFSDHSLVVNSDGGFSSESVCNSPEKSIGGNKNGTSAILHGANRVSSSVLCHQASFLSKDSHVKFSIKSIRVPELFIEVPETATVASLKKTVVKAVTALLSDGLHVGVLLHGKKVRDDNRTLLQTGITSKENLDTLSFGLEPTPEPAFTPLCTDDPPVPLSCDISQLVSRSPASPVVDTGISDGIPDPLPLTCLDNKVQDNQQPVSSHTDIVTDTAIPDSKALVAVPPVDAEALTLVPVNQKSKRTELVQRRTRRPFSVTEVEALVTAVEELGTGRWRDVKLRSFENADHRTYVDLKDKWKTLVHTAKITPQQRRGEPVPQELLDRVLAAHAYWSEHQGRPHNKNQTAIVKIADNNTYAD